MGISMGGGARKGQQTHRCVEISAVGKQKGWSINPLVLSGQELRGKGMEFMVCLTFPYGKLP